MACGRFIFKLVCYLMVLGANFDLCKKTFYQTMRNDHKTSKLLGKKKGCTNRAEKIRRYSHFTKRFAVSPTAQKDSPLSHKGVEMTSPPSERR